MHGGGADARWQWRLSGRSDTWRCRGGRKIDARSPGGVIGWADKLIHYGGVGRVEELHSITTRKNCMAAWRGCMR